MANCFNPTTRTPWNNVIFPGNYVTRLNAYRNQGVNALPGVQFFRLVGALVVLPVENTQSNVLNSSGQLPNATYGLQILSPDLGPSPKPLVNRNFVVPTGAAIYRSAVNVVNMAEATAAGTGKVTVSGISSGAELTAEASGFFNECGAWTAFDGLGSITATSSDTSVTVTTSGAALKPINVTSGGSGSALADSDAGQSAILVEVCYFMNNVGPDADDVNLPFPVEGGSST